MRLLLLDNYDSFTFNLYQQLIRVGVPFGLQVEVRRNDAISATMVGHAQFDAIVLSPGPGRPVDAGISLEIIERLAGMVPIFGVCLGHQAIAQAFGAKIVRAPRAIHGKTSPVNHSGHGLFKLITSPFNVARYHSLAVEPDSLPSDLEISASSDDGVIMGIEHRKLPLWGVQFHPESFLTQYGDTIIQNFLANVVELGSEN